MRKILSNLKKILAEPQMRPFEIWLFRIVAAYVAARLGIQLGEKV